MTVLALGFLVDESMTLLLMALDSKFVVLKEDRGWKLEAGSLLFMPLYQLNERDGCKSGRKTSVVTLGEYKRKPQVVHSEHLVLINLCLLLFDVLRCNRVNADAI